MSNYVGRQPAGVDATALTALEARVATLESHVPTLGTPVSLSGLATVDFPVPSWAKHVVVNVLDMNGSAGMRVQLGTAASVETTGYVSTVAYQLADGSEGNIHSTAGFDGSSIGLVQQVHLSLLNPSNNTWIAGIVGRMDSTYGYGGAGRKSLAGVLTRVRLTTNNGSAFTAGSGNVVYW